MKKEIANPELKARLEQVKDPSDALRLTLQLFHEISNPNQYKYRPKMHFMYKAIFLKYNKYAKFNRIYKG